MYPFANLGCLSAGFNLCFGSCFLICVLVLGYDVTDSLGLRKLIGQGLSRKLVHILSGLLFLVSWPIFRYPILCFIRGRCVNCNALIAAAAAALFECFDVNARIATPLRLATLPLLFLSSTAFVHQS